MKTTNESSADISFKSLFMLCTSAANNLQQQVRKAVPILLVVFPFCRIYENVYTQRKKLSTPMFFGNDK
jgi:hypothetical protein